MRVALVNTNRIKPPIAPIGIDYIAETLACAGHDVAILDLCWESDFEMAICNFLSQERFDVIGVSLRNTDDCVFTSRQSFIDEFVQIVRCIREHTDAIIVIGGVGFSVMPELVLERCGDAIGIWGDGESAFTELLEHLRNGDEICGTSGLIFEQNGKWHRNRPTMLPLSSLPPMTRTWVDNARYFREGGQGGFETKRGCIRRCIYCADTIAKGRVVRLRPPKDVADEIEHLLAQGVDHLHTCDSEFNVPMWHAKAVCEELIRHGLGEKLRWYAYCAPVPFDDELANLMRRAGCVGINFGVDNGDGEMLRRLRRKHAPDDIITVAQICKRVGISIMFDLLLGAPGETIQSLRRTIELMKRAEADRVGVAVGVRVYPSTELANMVMQSGLRRGVIGADDSLLEPTFFIEPAVANCIFDVLHEAIGDDVRFFFTDPAHPERNYNYASHDLLVDAIQRGHRGAYWDILRRVMDEG